MQDLKIDPCKKRKEARNDRKIEICTLLSLRAVGLGGPYQGFHRQSLDLRLCIKIYLQKGSGVLVGAWRCSSQSSFSDFFFCSFMLYCLSRMEKLRATVDTVNL